MPTHGKCCNLLASETLGFYSSLTAVARCSPERICAFDFQRSFMLYLRISPFILSCLVAVLKRSLVFLKWLSSCIPGQVCGGCNSSAVMRQVPIAKGIPQRFLVAFVFIRVVEAIFKRQWFSGNYREAFISGVVTVIFNCSPAMFSNGCLGCSLTANQQAFSRAFILAFVAVVLRP